MKRIIKIAALVSIVMLLSASFISAQEHNHMHHDKSEKVDSSKSVELSKIDKNQDGKVYQCSMCSDQISDKPGECSKCGMKLSKVSVNETNKNMMDHGEMMDHSNMKDNSEMMDHSKMDHSKMESAIVREGVIDVAVIDVNNDGKVYSCPMCSDVISDEAGRCPKCEMKLKEYSIEDSEKNLDEYQKKQK